MKKAAIFLVFVLSLIMSFGCAKNSPTTTPEPVPTATAVGVYVQAVVINRPDTTNKTVPYVMLKHGNEGGTVINDATVTFNSAALSFDSVSNSYTASVTFAAAGTTASLAVNSASGNLTGSVVLPPYITVTSPAQGITVSHTTTTIPLVVSTATDPGWFTIISNHMPTYLAMLAGGMGDVRTFNISPSLAGIGDDIVIVRASFTGTLTGATTDSDFWAEDQGGQLVMRVE